MTKKDTIRTNVYLPRKLHEEAKKRGFNLSKFLTQHLEMELYQENPEFVKKKIKELDQNYTKARNVFLTKLKLAEEHHQKKKERLSTEKPEVMDYRTTLSTKEHSK